jgi:hypothetical protein
VAGAVRYALRSRLGGAVRAVDHVLCKARRHGVHAAEDDAMLFNNEMITEAEAAGRIETLKH